MLRDKKIIMEEIAYCRARQNGLLHTIGVFKTRIATTELSISKISAEIEVLEDQLWWLRFISYCNTSAWGFTC